MEVVKARKGRVFAAKQPTRRVTVHYRTEPIVTQGWAERPQTVADWALIVVAALCFTGIVPMALAEGLIWLLDPLPGWVSLPLMLAMDAAAFWALLRVALTGDAR